MANLPSSFTENHSCTVLIQPTFTHQLEHKFFTLLIVSKIEIIYQIVEYQSEIVIFTCQI